MADQKTFKSIITTTDSYKPVGPYSQAILAGKTVYVSGTLGLDRENKMVSGGISGQTRQALENLKCVLEAAGSSLQSVVKTTILLANIEDFAEFNKIYSEFFTSNFPTRITFQAGRLPMNAAIEIDAIALVGEVVNVDYPCNCCT